MSIQEATEHQMNQAFSELKKNYLTGKTRSYQWRMEQLLSLKKIVKQLYPEMEKAKQKDLGMSGYQTLLTIRASLDQELDHAISNLKNWMQTKPCETPVLIYPSNIYHEYEPLGVALIISSWNYPFATALSPLVCHIAAGNVVIMKPSEVSVESSHILKDVMDRMDQKYFRCIEGGKDTSVFLNKLPFDHITFTGSSKTGTFIAKDASANLSKLCLELGGCNFCVIDTTANIDLTAKRIVAQKFLNCGQTCIAPNYIFFPKSIRKEFLEKINYYMDNLLDEKSQQKSYSLMINQNFAKRALNMIEEVKDSVISQKGEANVEGRYIPPTVVLNPSWDSELMKDEIFAPILPLVEYEDFNDVLTRIKNSPKCLSMYYFGTVPSSNYQRLKNETSSGSLVTNDLLISYMAYTAGFGGVGWSGMGKIKGFDGFEDCSHKKVIIEKGTTDFLDIDHRYKEMENSYKLMNFVLDNTKGRTVEPYMRFFKFAIVVVFVAFTIHQLFSRKILVLNLRQLIYK